MNEALTPEENKRLAELVEIAGGIPLKGEIARLNEVQQAILPVLKRKGYVMVAKSSYCVIPPPKTE